MLEVAETSIIGAKTFHCESKYCIGLFVIQINF